MNKSRKRKLYCAYCNKLVKSDEFRSDDGALVVHCSKCKTVLYSRQRIPENLAPKYTGAG